MRRLSVAIALSLALGTAFATAPAPVLYNSDDGAQVHCPLDKVVWLNTKTHLYYKKGSKDYANSPHGGFVCLQDAKKAGNKPGAK